MDTQLAASLLAVAEEGTVTAAAVRLGFAQSTVSAHLKGLERELGVRLFDRVGRRVELTPRGEAVVIAAEALLRAEAELRRAADDPDVPSGVVSIGAPETICAYTLPDVIASVRRRAPAVRVRLVPSFGQGLLSAVQSGRVDLGLSLDARAAPSVPGVAARALGHEAVDLLVAPDHAPARFSDFSATDLSGETLLVTAPGCSYRDLALQWFAAAGGRAGHVLEFGSVEAIKASVATGMGVAVLPSTATVADVRLGRLAAMTLSPPAPPFVLSLLRNEARTPSAASLLTEEVIVELVGQQPLSA